MARYFLTLTDDQGVVIARFPIESDDAKQIEYYEKSEDVGDMFPDELYSKRAFGKDVQTEIDAHERNV